MIFLRNRVLADNDLTLQVWGGALRSISLFFFFLGCSSSTVVCELLSHRDCSGTQWWTCEHFSELYLSNTTTHRQQGSHLLQLKLHRQLDLIMQSKQDMCFPFAPIGWCHIHRVTCAPREGLNLKHLHKLPVSSVRPEGSPGSLSGIRAEKTEWKYAPRGGAGWETPSG